MKAGPLVLCVLAAALFGVSSPVSKALLGSLSPLTLAGLLYLGAALAVLPFSLSGGSREARRARKNLARLAGVVLFGGVLGPALLLFGLSTAPAASVSLWLNLETPATALLGWMFFKEHLDRRVVVAVVLVTIASALLAGASGAALVPSALLVAAACACWGLDNNLSATIDGFTPAQSTLAKGVAAGAVNLALGVVVERPTFVAANVGAALLLGSLSYGASIVLYVRSAQQLGAVRSQLVFSSAPFFGVVIAWVALHEPVLATQLGAMAMMIGAALLLHRERHAHEHTHEEVTHTHWHRHDDDHHDHVHDPPVRGGHVHEHRHDAKKHVHQHRPDLHHRHEH
jgi:drug/metabolite transporter (DMT)-like permease